MTTTSATGSDAWYDSISVFSSDYEPATFTPGASVEANHDLLNGLRENDFDVEDSQYGEMSWNWFRMSLPVGPSATPTSADASSLLRSSVCAWAPAAGRFACHLDSLPHVHLVLFPPGVGNGTDRQRWLQG